MNDIEGKWTRFCLHLQTGVLNVSNFKSPNIIWFQDRGQSDSEIETGKQLGFILHEYINGRS